MTQDAQAIAEETARTSYGRLLAAIASRSRNLAAAEDALADAFAAALDHWPRSGVPDSPEAWLITTARRKLIDHARREQTRTAAEPDLVRAMEEIADRIDNQTFPDERLKLMFVCAHPAIDRTIRTPLILQAVLGLDAARIASAFLVAPATMGQRLVRAKRKIAAASIPFEEPSPADLPARMTAVLDAVYAAFGAGYDGLGADPRAADLTAEALFLCRLLTQLAPDAAEAWGLFALMQFVDARRNARRPDGVYTPLSEQDPARWDRPMIDNAEHALARAWALQSPGRFQLEAAIQSAHCAAVMRSADTSEAILTLYGRLLEIAPSTGAQIGRAAALIAAGRHREAIEALDRITPQAVETYQPYWATRAHALAGYGDPSGAEKAFQRAIALSEDAAIRAFLAQARRNLTE